MKNMLSISLAVFCVLCQCARAETDEGQIRKKIDLIAKSKDANQVILRNKDNTLLAFDLTDEEFAAINVLLASLKK